MVAPHHHTLKPKPTEQHKCSCGRTRQQLRVPQLSDCPRCVSGGDAAGVGQEVVCRSGGEGDREGPLRWKLPCITSAVNLNRSEKQDLLTLKMYPFNTDLLFLFFHSLLLFLSKEYQAASEHGLHI